MFESEISQKLTLHAKKSLKEAEPIARYYNSKNIEPEHLLLAIFLEKGSLGNNILKDLGITRAIINKIVINKKETESKEKYNPGISKELKEIITKAYSLASKLDYPYVGTEHIVYVLLESSNESIKKIIQKSTPKNKTAKKDKERTTGEKMSPLNGDIFSNLSKTLNFPNISLSKPKSDSDTPHLNHFCIDLNKEVEKRNELIIGRKGEIERMINILGRKNKNNPLLIGDPGVGKTAIVKGLAQRINSGNVPLSMINKRILSLDIALVVAGTSFRGEFENRLKEIIKESSENENVILFIDEIHGIVGAGNVNGGLDAANILKPALSQGDIQCIGASTLDEYKKYIEKDPALERRFQPITVQEPSAKDTEKILLGIKNSYENYHNVKISKEAIKEAVKLSVRYVQDRFLPDKAIDVIDETASRIQNQKKIPAAFKKIKELEFQRDQISILKTELISEEDYDKAINLRKKEDTLSLEIEKLKEKNSKDKNEEEIQITEEEIARTVSSSTGIPIEKLLSQRTKKLQTIENKLNSNVIGQEEAVKKLTDVVIRSQSGISDPEKPVGSFLFLGPSGVGKTLTAKLLAQEFFDDENALIRIDMSEFMERHHISQLIGAPAGYVGYGEGGKLTEKVRQKPHSLILFDEIEKAHPDTFNILLQILEDGHLTDAEGRRINFKNNIIILTSNIGTNEFTNAAKIGFDKNEELKNQFEGIKNNVLRELNNHLRPELINRLDHIIVFNPLEKSEIKRIVRIELNKLKQRIKEKGLKLSYSPKVIEMLANKSLKFGRGARYVRKGVQDLVENEVAKAIINERVKDNKIQLKIEGDKLIAI